MLLKFPKWEVKESVVLIYTVVEIPSESRMSGVCILLTRDVSIVCSARVSNDSL